MARILRTARGLESPYRHWSVTTTDDGSDSHIKLDLSSRNLQTACDLLALPEELRLHIFEYFWRPSDLAIVLLVCKAFYNHALPLTYHEIDIDIADKIVDGEFKRKYSCLVEPRNPGLKHLKRIAVRPNVYEGYSFLYSWVEHLQATPKGQLVEFKWRDSATLSDDLTNSLWKQHLKLGSLQLLGGHGGFYTFDHSVYLHSHITELEVCPRSWSAVSTISMAMWRWKVQKLRLDGRDLEDNGSLLSKRPGDNNPSICNFYTELLRLKQPVAGSPHSHLSSLELADVDLASSAKHWGTYTDFSELTMLSLKYCRGPDTFLATMLETSKLILESLIIVHILRPAEKIVELAENVVRSQPGCIQHLELCFRQASKKLDPATVNVHREKLRVLALDMKSADARKNMRYTAAEVEVMLTGCDDLSQLAVHFALAIFRFDVHDLEGPFCCDERSDFQRSLKLLFTKVSLTTLNLLSWPCGYEGHENNEHYLQHNLQRLAWLILKATRYELYDPCKHRRRLEVLAFGAREKHTRSMRKKLFPRYFVEGETRAMHKTRKMALQIDLRELLLEGQSVDILHHNWRIFDKELRGRSKAFYVFDEGSDERFGSVD